MRGCLSPLLKGGQGLKARFSPTLLGLSHPWAGILGRIWADSFHEIQHRGTSHGEAPPLGLCPNCAGEAASLPPSQCKASWPALLPAPTAQPCPQRLNLHGLLAPLTSQGGPHWFSSPDDEVVSWRQMSARPEGPPVRRCCLFVSPHPRHAPAYSSLLLPLRTFGVHLQKPLPRQRWLSPVLYS